MTKQVSMSSIQGIVYPILAQMNEEAHAERMCHTPHRCTSKRPH